MEGTPLDFRNATAVGDRIDQLAGGYDHNFVLDRAEDRAVEPLPAAEVYCPNSGRLMTLLTTEPGVQLYTGNLLGPLLGKGGIVYQNRGALCLETQHFPDSVNKPQFPSVILRPGEKNQDLVEKELWTRTLSPSWSRPRHSAGGVATRQSSQRCWHWSRPTS